MTDFPLKIVTPDGVIYDGMAQELIVRTAAGDLGILAGHMNCVSPVGMGRATVVIDGKPRYAACIGGVVTVMDGAVTLVPTTFEWADRIDFDRAERSRERAESILHSDKASRTDITLAEAKLKRALVRTSVAKR